MTGPTIVLLLACVVGGVTLAAWSRDLWFTTDDLRLIGERYPLQLGALLEPHNDHWSTVVLLIDGVLNRWFGMTDFFPYLMVGIAVHLTVVVLVYAVMIRSRVDPWLAAALSIPMIVYGPGFPLVPSQFQMPLAVCFGLAQLLLVDVERPPWWRSALGLFAGLLAIATSGVGVAMVAGVGTAVLIRRGWLAAAVQVIPLAAVYSVWWATFGGTSDTPAPDPALLPAWFAEIFRAVFAPFADFPLWVVWLAIVAATLAVGWWLAWRDRPTYWRSLGAAPIGLVISALAVGLTSWLGRSGFGLVALTGGRFTYVVYACLAPAIAIAVGALVRRHRLLWVPALVALLLATVGNIVTMGAWLTLGRVAAQSMRDTVDVAVHIAQDPHYPDEAVPIPTVMGGLRNVSLGFLRGQLRSGRLAAPTEPGSPEALAEARLRATVTVVPTVAQDLEWSCRTIAGPKTLWLRPGVLHRIDTPMGEMRVEARSGPLRGVSTVYSSWMGDALSLTDDERLQVRVVPEPAGTTLHLCRTAK